MKNKKLLATAVIIAIVIVVAVGMVAFPSKKASQTQADPTTAPTTADTSSQTASTGSTYKDGTYTATGSYESPGGTESITISLTIANDKVTATTATSGANDHDAVRYQAQFIAGYKSQVVGKSLAGLQLSRVSGSSLTSQGFNDAVAQIQAQAKA